MTAGEGTRTITDAQAFCDERTIKGGLVALPNLGFLLRINRKQRDEIVTQPDFPPFAARLRGKSVWTVEDVVAVRSGTPAPNASQTPGFLDDLIVDNEQFAALTGKTLAAVRIATNTGKIYGDGRAGVDWWWWRENVDQVFTRPYDPSFAILRTRGQKRS